MRQKLINISKEKFMSKWKLTTGTNEVHEEWVKGDIVFRKVTSLKSYIWYIYTSDEKPPKFEFSAVPGGDGELDSINMHDTCINNIEQVEVFEEGNFFSELFIWPEKVDKKDRENIETLWEKNSYSGLEESGWHNLETEHWIWEEISVEPYDP
jgi:hypothetical protein